MNASLKHTCGSEAQFHILVVEDEFLVRMMLSDILREANYIVTEAYNADEALTLLSSEWPDLIITDVRMPGSCDGLELTARVREANVKLPIIVTSAHLVPDFNQFSGPTHFLPKPYEFNVVVKLVESELSK
jgi:CheY-like chemotaxis protein